MGGFRDYIRRVEEKPPLVSPSPPKHEWPFKGSPQQQERIAYNIGRLLTYGQGLEAAFRWASTPQGHNYWGGRERQGLDDEAIGILDAWLEDYRGQF